MLDHIIAYVTPDLVCKHQLPEMDENFRTTGKVITCTHRWERRIVVRDKPASMLQSAWDYRTLPQDKIWRVATSRCHQSPMLFVDLRTARDMWECVARAPGEIPEIANQIQKSNRAYVQCPHCLLVTRFETQNEAPVYCPRCSGHLWG